MDIQITALAENHLEDAAALVGSRYRGLCLQVPELPAQYSQPDTLLPLLQNILQAGVPGVAAIRDKKLVGFLTAWQMQSFRGKKSIYSPEWANAAILEKSPRIYEEMYARLAESWVADGCVAHYISLFPSDVRAINAFNRLCFGMVSVDALRSLDPIPVSSRIIIRKAEVDHIDEVIDLQNGLWHYMKASPIFLLAEKKERSYYEEWLQAPDRVVWLAYDGDEPVAFMRLGPADEEVCTIIVDDRTTSIYAAYTQADSRSQGLATALLDHALQDARRKGYTRCAVSFEPMNLLGSRFWLRYFKPVCYSVVRHIDERLV